jgi:hypothetical protein
MKLLIKNRVSLRCKLIVKSELEKMDLHYTVVELGEVKSSRSLIPLSRKNFKGLY